MFIQAYSALLSHFRIDALEIPAPDEIRLARAEADALEAMRAQPQTMLLSERLKDPQAYRALQRERRQMLLSLLIARPSRASLERIVDLISLICEESTWSRNDSGSTFDDENHPSIDLSCAETAVLLGWTLHRLNEQLDARTLARIRSEVRRRLFKPVLVHDDYPFLRGGGVCPMTIAADLLLSALLIESDEARMSRVLKSALKLLDESCLRHGRDLAPLEESVRDISAITDLVHLLRTATDGFVDLTDSIPTGDWLDEILYSWIQDDLFNDPAGADMQPKLSGSDIFRIGEAANDAPLTDLGAHLHHRSHLPAATITGQLMELSCAARLESSFGKPHRLRYAAMRGNLLMTARMPGLYCSMHAGGGRENAGDICLFSETAPILIDGGQHCTARSLPVLAGCKQLPKPLRPCIADFEVREDREILSVELTHAYPAECPLNSYQRTVLVLRGEHTIRIVDAIDLAEPSSVTFRFVCAVAPTIAESCVHLGSVRMTWEGEFSVRASELNEKLRCLELTAAAPVRQAFFTFNFERA